MPPRATDIRTARHYRWGGSCDGWHLLESPHLSVIQERVPAGAGESPHRHARARQFFYILSGQARMEFSDGQVDLDPGQGVHVAPGVAHRFANRGHRDVVFLVISAPSTAGDRQELPAAAWRDADGAPAPPPPAGS